jgi:hypothetical protein
MHDEFSLAGLSGSGNSRLSIMKNDTQRGGMTIRGMKSVMLLCVVGTLLVSGCMSPLYKAALRSDINTVKGLLDKGADVNERIGLHGDTALKAASSAGRVDTVKLLLDRGADVNLTSGNMGWTALSGAAWRGHTDVARLLIERGADINKAIAGLRRRRGTGDAVDLLNELKRNWTTPAQGQGASAVLPTHPATMPTTLPLPAEQATPF